VEGKEAPLCVADEGEERACRRRIEVAPTGEAGIA
jgi:hypothetical protein